MNLDLIINLLTLLASIGFLISDRLRRREIERLKYSLTRANIHIRQLQGLLKEADEKPAWLDQENQRLHRLLREMRASFRRRLGRPEGGININWPYIP